jgi:hypothetical protein
MKKWWNWGGAKLGNKKQIAVLAGHRMYQLGDKSGDWVR